VLNAAQKRGVKRIDALSKRSLFCKKALQKLLLQVPHPYEINIILSS
jgi:hypothetical protein